MITPAAIAIAEKSAPSQGGNASNAAATQGQEFLAAVNRISFSSSPAATLLRDTPVLDAERAAIDEARVTDYRAEEPRSPFDEREAADRADLPAAEPTEPQTAPDNVAQPASQDVSERPSSEAPSAAVSTTAAKDPEAPVATRENTAVRSNAAAPAAPNAAAERNAPPPPQTTPVNTTAPNQTPVPQQTRTQGGQANGLPGAQIVVDGAADQLPQTSQTLSSRAALVTQSQTGKGTADVATPKAATGEAGVSSLFAGTAQTAGNNAGKSKAIVRTGTNTHPAGAQNATPAQASQGTSQQMIAQAAVPLQTQQQSLANSPFGTGTGTGTGAGPAGQQTLSARAETFTPAGASQSTAEFNLRGTASAHVPRPATPVPARIVTNQVAVQIQKAVGQGNDRISIQLKPADLGRVEVRLEVGADGRVAALISADRSDTLDLLQRDARILQNSLQNAGLQADSNSLSFELKGQNQAFGESGNGKSNGEEFVESETETNADIAAAALAQTGIVSSDRIDIQI